MEDQPSLGSFPVDPLTLDMVEASLKYCLTIDEETGDPVPVDPDVVSLSDLCDFLSGTSTDPLGQVEFDGEIDGIKWYTDHRPHYSERDIIQALIDEVRKLRSEIEDLRIASN